MRESKNPIHDDKFIQPEILQVIKEYEADLVKEVIEEVNLSCVLKMDSKIFQVKGTTEPKTQ